MSLEDNPFARPPAPTRALTAATPGVTWGFGSLPRVAGSPSPCDTTSMPSIGFPTLSATSNLAVAGQVPAASPSLYPSARMTSVNPTSAGTSSTLAHSDDAFELTYEQLRIGAAFSGRADSEEEDAYYNALKFKNPDVLLPQDVKNVRLYLPADLKVIPFSWLDSLLTSKKTSFPSLCKIEVCFRSLLRPFLEDLYIAAYDHRDSHYRSLITSILSKYVATSVSLEIKFRCVNAANERDEVQNFRVIPLMKAICGLDEHSLELTEILGEESTVKAAPDADAVEKGCPINLYMARPELDEYL